MDVSFFMVILLTVILPLWMILHYGSKKHQERRLTADDERMLEDLWRSAKAMERRLQALESITDTERPAHADTPRPADRTVM